MKFDTSASTVYCEAEDRAPSSRYMQCPAVRTCLASMITPEHWMNLLCTTTDHGAAWIETVLPPTTPDATVEHTRAMSTPSETHPDPREYVTYSVCTEG